MADDRRERIVNDTAALRFLQDSGLPSLTLDALRSRVKRRTIPFVERPRQKRRLIMFDLDALERWMEGTAGGPSTAGKEPTP